MVGGKEGIGRGFKWSIEEDARSGVHGWVKMGGGGCWVKMGRGCGEDGEGAG